VDACEAIGRGSRDAGIFVPQILYNIRGFEQLDFTERTEEAGLAYDFLTKHEDTATTYRSTAWSKSMKLSNMVLMRENPGSPISVNLVKIGGAEVLPRVQFHFLPHFLNKHVIGSIDTIQFSRVDIDARFFQMIEATEPERLRARFLQFIMVDARQLSIGQFKQLLGKNVKEYLFSDVLLPLTPSEMLKLPMIRQATNVSFMTEYFAHRTISTDELLDFLMAGPDDKLFGIMKNYLANGCADLLRKLKEDFNGAKTKRMFRLRIFTHHPEPCWPDHETHRNRLGEELAVFKEVLRGDLTGSKRDLLMLRCVR